MSVNSITTGGFTASQLPSFTTAGTDRKPVKGTSSAQETASQQAVKSGAADPGTTNKISPDKAHSAVAVNKNSGEPAGVVNHVVVSYNQQGKMRTKFEDSRNNVVYQLPSEAAAKLEDQISSSSRFTSVKG
jgi:hypothetical protein